MKVKIVKRKDRIKVRMMEALSEKAVLSNNRGRVIYQKYPRPNSKTRRHSGRKTIFCDDEDYPTQLTFYDDWKNFRDGFRNGYRDKTRLFKHPCCFYWDEHIDNAKRLKEKIKRQVKIRKARKFILCFQLLTIHQPSYLF